MNSSTMGGACSMHRNGTSSRRETSRRNSGHRMNRDDESTSSTQNCFSGRRYSRHSVVQQIPDRSISRLYAIGDNYVTNADGSRSPKSLAELCTRTLCRSLPDLDGSLPSGLPQEIVDDILESLVRHSALNATTLRVLQNCELRTLPLAGCRGVNDDFIHGLVGTMDLDSPTGADDASPPEVCCENSVIEESWGVTTAPTNPFDDVGSVGTRQFECKKSDNSGLKEDEDYYSISSDHYDDEQPMSSSNFTNLTNLDLRGCQRLTDKALLQMPDLPNLQTAQLDNCYCIVGRGMLAFSNSFCLRTLSLANCRRLQDEAIINISHVLSLEALSLVGCRCITDRSLAAVAGLRKLKKLDVSQCDLITDAGLEEIYDLTQLEELSLGWCRSITDRGLRTLVRQPGRSQNLRCLCLARIPITDDGVGHLASLRALEELDLNGCSNMGSAVLGHTLELLPHLTSLDVAYCPGILRSSWQGKISSLRVLDLCYSGVRDSHLSRLTDLPCLQELSLCACPVGDWALAHLADNEVIPNLTSLDLSDTEVSDLGMTHVEKFKKLKCLSLFYCNLSNSSLRNLSQLSELEALNLDSRDIGDSGIWHLRGLKKLKSLDIFSGRITDSGCSHIAKIKSLECLELCGGGISDVGCTILATLENLTSLNLSQNDRITNRGAAALAALSNLKALNLSNTRVNSSALIHFSDLINLKSLSLYGCRGMDETDGLRQLQSGLPNLKCIRLNNGPDDDNDGIIPENDDDSDDDDDSALDDSEQFVERRNRSAASFQDADSDSEMEVASRQSEEDGRGEGGGEENEHDEDAIGDEESDTSWSDHDYHH